jgi:class 3 adenylate cyclase/tetratricopeptide (TPR) repeat protein
MTCPACGTANPGGSKFCGECGTRLALTCAACGSGLQPGQKFCGECGAPTAVAPAQAPAAAAAPTSPPGIAAAPADPARDGSTAAAPIAERRLVSVLFADLVGHTTYSEGRDAEEVRELLSRYFDIAREAIGRHGGTIEKFIGDAVMAVWGTPTAREDDAERAVRAALELLSAIRELGPGISARAGVLTGEAAVTLGATDQGMVAGDLPNTAARLQAAAVPNSVLVGEATFRATSAAIAYEESGEVQLKGKDAPIATWRALRVVAERRGRGRAEMLEAPFTGRDEELRLLKELFHATAREKRARLVSVTGPAGIGKSRLAWEFEKYLDGVVDLVWWNHGRSPAYGEGITFWALGEMIRGRCGLAETADEGETRAKVREMLARHLPDASDREWVEPAILQLLGAGTSAVSADQLFARWRLLFERLAASGTVVLVFEDLHWADAGTLDFIDHLLDWSKSIPLLVVTLARPELLDARPDWGAGRRSFVALPLDPLPEAEMRALLAGLVPGLPDDAVRQIIVRAEGIPLYAVETIRMLVAEKRLEARGSVYVPVGDISTLAVPETLTALIAARLDALDPGDRSIVLDAAVLGQRFTLQGLAAVSGQDEATLEPRLRGLVRRELLSLEADPRSPERGQYGFVQALIREVAYHTLAKRDRKDRHLAAARFFESLGSDELAGALAGHYLSAHANAAEGAEADALATQARIALRGAADRAAALGSYEQAGNLLRQALTVAAQPADRAELEERLGAALHANARYAEAAAAYRAALETQVAAGDRASAARVTTSLGEVLITGKLMDDAMAVLEAGVVSYADVPDVAVMLAMKGQLARCYLLSDMDAKAVVLADEVLAEAERGGHMAILADVLVTKGTALGAAGRNIEGAALLVLGGRIADEHGFLTTRFRALNNHLVVIGESEPRRAYESTLEGLALARRMGSDAWARGFAGNLGYMAYRTGEWDHAEEVLRSVLDEHPDPGDGALMVNNLISIVSSRGGRTDALVLTLQEMCRQLPPQQARSLLPDSRAYVAQAAGRFAEAAELWLEAAGDGIATGATSLLSAAMSRIWANDPGGARHALARFEALRLREPALTAQRDGVEGALVVLDGSTEEGLATMRGGHRQLESMGLPDDAARVALTAAMAAGPAHPLVVDMVRQARGFWDGVRAAAMLRLLDEATGGDPGDAAVAAAGPAGEPRVKADAEEATA